MNDYTVDTRTRLTPEQHSQLAAIARKKGMTLSTYIRTVLLERLEQETVSRQDSAATGAEGVDG